jgi:antirestriction protein ArdC
MDIAQVITDKIIAELESGTAPWVKPWSAVRGTPTRGMPYNPVSKTLYRGVNHFWLSMMPSASQHWLTYKQAAAAGGQVRKGEKGTPIVFWQISDRKTTNDAGEDATIKSVLLKHYTVFSLEQIDGLSFDQPADLTESVSFPEITPVESVVDRLRLTGGLFHGGDGAFYTPSRDSITMPLRQAFKTDADYCATLLHEAVHATGHKSRLDRLTPSRFGSEGYAYEELVAELGAAMLCAQCGVDGQLQHSSYIENWLRVLKNDKKFILTAAAHAQKAIDWIDSQSIPMTLPMAA